MRALPTIDEIVAAATRTRPTRATLGTELASLRPIPGDSPVDRLEAIAPALEQLSDGTSDVRRYLAGALPALTGFHPRMIEVGLEIQCERLAPETLSAMMAGPHPRIARERMPTAIVHAGNIPALAALDVAVALLAGDAVAVKTASREPLTGAITAELFSAAAGVPCAAALACGREDGDLLDTLLGFGDRLVAYGSDRSIEDVSERWRRVRGTGRARERLTFGHRLSVAWVPHRGFEPNEQARRLAVDVALWDQEGCLSPHVVFVDARVDAEALGDALADALGTLAATLPRGARSLAERARARAWLSSFEAAVSAGTRAPARIWREPSGAYVVVLDPTEPAGPSPLGRAVRLVPVRDASGMLDAVSGWPLQAIAVGDDPARHTRLAARVHRLGVTRLCATGRLQEPGPAWVGEERRVDGTSPFALERETPGVWSMLFVSRDAAPGAASGKGHSR